MIQKYELKNGLTLLFDEAPHFQSTALAVSFLGGARDEGTNEGITHLLEHLLFKRTTTKDTRQIAELIDELGGEVNAYTDSDSFCLYGVVPAQDGERLFRLLAEMVHSPAFTSDDLVVEKRIIEQEINDSLDNPQELAYRAFRSSLWPDHPLGRPITGTMESLAPITREDALARLKTVSVGRRMHIAAAGRFDGFFKLAEELFGSLPEGTRPDLSTPPCSFKTEVTAVEGQQVTLFIAKPAPSMLDPDYAAAVLLTSLLGQGNSGFLFQSLREEHGICYDIEASLESSFDSGLCTISGSFSPENTVRALELIEQELRRFTSHQVTERDFRRHQRMCLAQLEMEEDSVRSRIWRLLESELLIGRTISTAEIHDLLSSVTLEDINRVSDRFLKGTETSLILAGETAGLKVPTVRF